MDVLLVALGSAGDVLPFCALGRALVARGHAVTVATNPHFRGLVDAASLSFSPLGDAARYRELESSPQFMSRTKGFRQVMRWVETLIRPTYELVRERAPTLVAAHPLAFGARVAESHLGQRTATLLLSPATLQSAHTPPVLPGVVNSPAFPAWYKRSVWWAVDRWILDPMIAPGLNAFRKELGASPPLTRVFQDGWRSDHLFVALFPEWFAPRQPDWPTNLEFSGFPGYDGECAFASPLADFLAEGDAPIVFTPGSGNQHAREFFSCALEASRAVGRRALLLTRFSDHIPPLPAHARRFEYAPLGRLLVRACALVHHGGIGTAAAALAAGIPQVVAPFSHDQPDNAARLSRLAVAVELRRLCPSAMAAALAHVIESSEVARACRAAASAVKRTSLMSAALSLEGYALGRELKDAVA